MEKDVFGEKDEEFQVTQEELSKFRDAMKKKEFREMLVDYVKEIQDPQNRKRYEEEIIELERRRGQNVKFVNPKPGYVIKLYLDPGKRKIFVNMCTSEVVAMAISIPGKEGEKSGSDWHVPYTLTSPRTDLDKSGKRCMVYDCVFHPKTYKRGQKYPRFKQLLVETALEAVEEREGGKVITEKVKFLSMAYKGMMQPAVVREEEKKEDKQGEKRKKKKASASGGGGVEEDEDLPFGVQYPPLSSATSKKKSAKDKKPASSSSSSSTNPPSSTEPVYSIRYSGEVAIDDYTNDRVSSLVKRPKEIVVTIKLPKLSSPGTIELDVMEKQLILNNEDPPYHLDLALSYPVEEEKGNAEFDKKTRCLTVSLPVQSLPIPTSLPSPLPSPPSPPSSLATTSPTQSSAVASETQQIEQVKSTNQNTVSESCDPVIENESTNQISESDIRLTVTDITSSDDLTNQILETSHMTWAPRGDWVAPSFTYRQDNERVVFVLHSSHVKPSTLVHHHDNHQFQIMYTCSNGTNPISCSLLVRFHDNDLVENTSVNISEDNIVVMVTKGEECQREWVEFEAGSNTQNMQRKRFLTDSNVKEGVRNMEREDDPWKRFESESSSVTITSSENNTLELVIENCEEQPPQPTHPPSLSHPSAENNEKEEMKREASNSRRIKPGDPVDCDRDSNNTVVWNGDTTGAIGIECGHSNVQLTNDLLCDLD